jgi:hypothetical protein
MELTIALGAGATATVIFFSVSAVLHRDRLVNWLHQRLNQD